MKNQLKTRNNVRWEWKYHGEVQQPKIVCVRCVGTTGLSKHGFAVAQVTVKMVTKQVCKTIKCMRPIGILNKYSC